MYGNDDLVLDKQQKMNSVNDEINILQKQFERAKAEEKDINDYREKMGGGSSGDVYQSLQEVTKEVQLNKEKYKALLKQQKEFTQERDTYFKAVKEN